MKDDNGLTVGWGKWFANFRGSNVVTVVLATTGFMILLWVTVEGASSAKQGHESLMKRIDVAACLSEVQKNGELKQMREHLAQVSANGGNVEKAMRLRWCPWLKEDK